MMTHTKDTVLIPQVITIIVTSPPSSEVKVKTCKLFHFLLKSTKDLLTKFLCKYVKSNQCQLWNFNYNN